jgi:peptide/nickel transport system permease protein
MTITNTEIGTENLFGQMTGRGRSFFLLITSNKKLLFGLCVVAFFILVAICAPLLTRYDPSAFSNELSKHPSATHWLGTTTKGEDLFAQLIYGARVSLTIGFVSAIGSTLLQVLFGLTSGYFSGPVDDVLSLITNVFLVLPGLPLAIVLSSFAPLQGTSFGPVPRGFVILTLVLLFTTWSYGARVLRAQTMSLREREFVTAARASGETPIRIIFAEIMPNEIALVVSNFVTTFVYTILAEVALEYLGLGDTTISSWGVMLYWAQLNQVFLGGQWWWFVPPGLCVAIICAALTFVNFGIDELANPRLRSDRPQKSAKKKKEGAAV